MTVSLYDGDVGGYVMSRFLSLRIEAEASGGCGKGEIVQERRVGQGCVSWGQSDREPRCYVGSPPGAMAKSTSELFSDSWNAVS